MSEKNQQDSTIKGSLPETAKPQASTPPSLKKEIGGPKGPEPTRYGDWEKNGRCSDF